MWDAKYHLWKHRLHINDHFLNTCWHIYTQEQDEEFVYFTCKAKKLSRVHTFTKAVSIETVPFWTYP